MLGTIVSIHSAEEIRCHEAIQGSLSPMRLSTYATPFEENSACPRAASLELYIWNAQVSGAFMAPLQICEVVIRNAVSNAIEDVYGESWPWSEGFQISLNSYFRKKIKGECGKASSVEKLIPEMNLGFWKSMFTKRFQKRIWEGRLLHAFPNLDYSKSIDDQRSSIANDLEKIRILRNRIAHHEPIFKRDLREDLSIINRLVGLRCTYTQTWMQGYQQGELASLLDCCPLPSG